MLKSLVRVSRRVLRVTKAIDSPTGNLRFGQSEDTALLTAGQARRRHWVRTSGYELKELAAGWTHTQSWEWIGCCPIPSVYRHADDRATEGLPGAPKRRRNDRRPLGLVGHRQTTGRNVLLGEQCTTTTPECSIRRRRALANGTMNGPPGASRTNGSRTPFTMNFPIPYFGFRRFTPERFRVILNSLFKVLSNFLSRYFFAIGLVVVFSLRWISTHT